MNGHSPIKDKVGHITHYRKTMSSGEMRITDKQQRRLGYVKNGKTYDHSGHILAHEPRIDLIMKQKR
jgi:hypothetical protein